MFQLVGSTLLQGSRACGNVLLTGLPIIAVHRVCCPSVSEPMGGCLRVHVRPSER
jgi:hypothetical protein